MSFNNQNIKFIAVFKESGSEPNVFFCPESFSQSVYLKQLQGAFVQIKRLELQNEERQSLHVDKNVWNCVKDSKNDIFYFVLSVNSYPERHAYGLLSKLEETVQNGPLDDPSLKSRVNQMIKDLYNKYNDLQQLDQLAAAQGVLDSTQKLMQDNIKKVIDNQKDIESLSKKAQDMRENAYDFNKNSAELKKIMYERNLKLKIIMGAIAFSIVGYIVCSVL